MTDDPTTAAISASNDERDQLRRDLDRFKREVVAAVSACEAQKDTAFVAGYDQAVREIRDHFKNTKQPEVVAEIEKIWIKGKQS